jgi:hypothetical protein
MRAQTQAWWLARNAKSHPQVIIYTLTQYGMTLQTFTELI